jgi:GT2 family glycosyltransferase
VILNYNDAETTIKLINQIKNFSLLDYIIIVDNFSSDDSYERLEKYNSDKVIVLKTQRNGGYGYGNNFGIRYAYEHLKSDFILISNPDVEFSEDCVRACRDALRKDQKCALVSPVAITSSGLVQPGRAFRIPGILEYTLTASILYNKFFGKMQYEENYFHLKDNCEVDCVPGSLLMVNAEHMIKYGMYDEDIFLYCEETTLGFRFRNHHLKSLLLLNQSYLHYHSVSITKSISSIVKRRKLILQSRAIFLRNNYKLSSKRMLLVRLFYKFALLENILFYKIKGEI